MAEATLNDPCAEHNCTFKRFCFVRAHLSKENGVVPTQLVLTESSKLQLILSQLQSRPNTLLTPEMTIDAGSLIAAYLYSKRSSEEWHALRNILMLLELKETNHDDLATILDELKLRYLDLVGLGQLGEIMLGTGSNHVELDRQVAAHQLQFECLFPCYLAGNQRCFRCSSVNGMKKHMTKHASQEVGIYAINVTTMRYAIALSSGQRYICQLVTPNIGPEG